MRSNIYCENGTNFTGANKALKKIMILKSIKNIVLQEDFNGNTHHPLYPSGEGGGGG